MRVWQAFILSAFLSGCAGTDAQLRLMEHDGALRVEPSQSPGYDYVVSVRNLLEYGNDNQATRNETALRALRSQCPAGRVVGETVISTGTYLLGNPARTYSVRVKCA